MTLRVLKLSLATAAIIVLASAAVGAAGTSASQPIQLDRCPAATDAFSAGAENVTLGEATAGVSKRLPNVFANLTPGLTFRVEILGGFQLRASPVNNSRFAPRDPVRFFSDAKRKCGARVASLSWGFFVWFPNAENVFSAGYVVLAAKTHGGWRIYLARNTS